MPELPEVETIRRDLEKEIGGKKIKAVEITGTRSARRHQDPADMVARMENRKVASVGRRGKYLLLRLEGLTAADKTDDVFVVHLGMSGQLLRAKGPKEPRPKHTHVVITFVGAGELRFVDPRTFGEVFVTTAEQVEHDIPELAHLGFDPIDDVISWNRFGDMLQVRHAKLKPLLMDQKFIAGIGNMYADEILWAAGLRYDRTSEALSSQEVRRLYRAMVETLQEAIKHRGSSLADEQYRDLFGELGGFQAMHQVYDREGKPCRRCRNLIVRVKAAGRSTFLCEQCQV